MDKLTFVLALLLLVGATKIHGDKPSILSQIHGELVPINPPDVLIEPIFEERTVPPEQINGRLLSPAEGCGYSSMGAPRVVGGCVARNGAYPWMALLGYKAQLGQQLAIGFKCGGTLITSRHVLSAAHCVTPDLWFARLGEHDIRTYADGDHEDHQIVDARSHPGYNKTISGVINDVAILWLEENVAFTNRIRPICLPISDHRMRSHVFMGNPFAAGWGQTGVQHGSPPYLKHVQVPLVEVEKCQDIFAKRGMYMTARQIEMTVCAGGVEGQSVCMGDSGGPLMSPVHVGNGNYSFYQIGITSWSIPCAWPDIPAAFMNVQYFGNWIQETII